MKKHTLTYNICENDSSKICILSMWQIHNKKSQNYWNKHIPFHIFNMYDSHFRTSNKRLHVENRVRQQSIDYCNLWNTLNFKCSNVLRLIRYFHQKLYECKTYIKCKSNDSSLLPISVPNPTILCSHCIEIRTRLFIQWYSY